MPRADLRPNPSWVAAPSRARSRTRPRPEGVFGRIRMPGAVPASFLSDSFTTVFDVGFSELMVIAVVALIVIGPERLPRVARTLGHLFGRLQRYVHDVKAAINREIELDELRKFKSTFEDAA